MQKYVIRVGIGREAYGRVRECVCAHADMEKPVATLSERRPQEGMLTAREENDRPTEARI